MMNEGTKSLPQSKPSKETIRKKVWQSRSNMTPSIGVLRGTLQIVYLSISIITLFNSMLDVHAFTTFTTIQLKPTRIDPLKQSYYNPHTIIFHNQPNMKSQLQRTFTTTTTKNQISNTSLQKSFFQNDDELQGPDKIKACIPYALPLLDGDQFGHFIYQRIPPLQLIDSIFIAPLVEILQHVPFLSILLFIAFSLGTRSVEGMSRVVRFNAQQAVLIDVALVFPTIISEGLSSEALGVQSGSSIFPRVLVECSNNFIWYAYMSAIIYSIVCNLNGKKPNGIPYVSDAAEYMTGPF